MARAVYVESITYMATDGTLKAADNIEVNIYSINSDGSRGPLATGKLWIGRTSATPQAATFLTPSTGFIQVWADEGDYDITFHDTAADPRIADTTIGWSAVSGQKTALAIGFEVGDVKLSSLSADHGRWLKMDGRTLTQSDVEGALSLAAGEGAAIVAHLGQGAASKYGAAPAGKIKLADTRRSFPMLAGPTGDGPGGLTARPLSAAPGGVETVTLTAAQSGSPAHTHTASQPSHNHGGSSQPSGAHSHGAATGAGGAHNHGGNTQLVDLQHTHAITAQLAPRQVNVGGPDNTVIALNDVRGATQAGATGGTKGYTSQDWGHPSGDTDTLNHQHVINMSNDHTHTISAAPDHQHVIQGATPTITVDSTTAAAASTSHDNMPPYVVLGFAFIRV